MEKFINIFITLTKIQLPTAARKKRKEKKQPM